MARVFRLTPHTVRGMNMDYLTCTKISVEGRLAEEYDLIEVQYEKFLDSRIVASKSLLQAIKGDQ